MGRIGRRVTPTKLPDGMKEEESVGYLHWWCLGGLCLFDWLQFLHEHDYYDSQGWSWYLILSFDSSLSFLWMGGFGGSGNGRHA